MNDTPRSNRHNPVSEEQSRHLPRILCLHGGGATGEIFRAQARSLIRHLPDFRLVFADAPFFSNAGPGILTVYHDYGPFRRWLRWLPEHPEIDDEAATDELMYAIETAKLKDEGDGPWIALMGFSQGAKLAASLLYDQQIRRDMDGMADTDYKFAVILAGRSPLVSLCDYSRSPACQSAGSISQGFHFNGHNQHVLRIPTIHVHGLADPGLHLHRAMLHQYHDPQTTSVLEWDGAHRVPIKASDVEPITREIYRIAKEQAVKV